LQDLTAETGAPLRPRSIFASRDFLLFYLGQATSYAGDGLRTVALPLLVFGLTGSALNLGITFALEFFPFGVFSLIGGSLADRLNRKRLMIGCDAVRFAIIGAFAAAYATHTLSLAFLYAGIVLHAVCGAIFNGGQASSVPYVVGKERATDAVSALVTAETLAGTIASPVGGALFGIAGPFSALAINAATYLASLLSLATIRDLGPEQTTGLPRHHEVLHDIALGFRFLWADTSMRLLTIASFLSNFVGTIGWVTTVPFLERDLGGDATTIGIAFGVMSLGAALGSFLAARIPYAIGTILVACYVWGALIAFPIMWTNSAALAIALKGLAAIPAGISISQIIAWRMRVIPEEAVGRVFGAVRLIVLAGILPGSLIGGALADMYGARMAQIVSILALAAVSAWLVSRREVRAEAR
jgi:MFS family permease